MKQYIYIFILAVTVIAVGCASGPGGQVANAVAGGVAYYCAQPPLTRVAIRASVAAQTAPNYIEIVCDGDEDLGYPVPTVPPTPVIVSPEDEKE